MKGIYVYGIIASGAVKNKLKSEGVDFGSQIEFYEYKDLKAVISEVDQSVMSKEEIERNLQTNIEWTKRNVKAHHAVIMELKKHGTVIPLRFATILLSMENLQRMMKDYYKRFMGLLVQLKNKQELGIKVFFNYEKAKSALRVSDRAVARSTANALAAPQGMQWYLEKKNQTMLREKISDTVETKLRQILDTFDKKSVKSTLNSPYPMVSDPEKGEMVLSGAFLVNSNYVGNFSDTAGEMSQKMEKEGFSIELTGPWPPYNFVNISSK